MNMFRQGKFALLQGVVQYKIGGSALFRSVKGEQQVYKFPFKGFFITGSYVRSG